MLDISTLFVYVLAFFEAFLKTSALHTGPAVGQGQHAAHWSGTLVLKSCSLRTSMQHTNTAPGAAGEILIDIYYAYINEYLSCISRSYSGSDATPT